MAKRIYNIDLPLNHYAFKIINEIKEICEPLNNYEITNFYFMRVCDEGFICIFITHSEYLQRHALKKYPINPNIPKQYLSKKFFYVGIPEYNSPFNQVYYDACNLFNIDNIIYLVERHLDYYDVYTYASTPNNTNIINFYLNNVDLLEKFKMYFNEKTINLFENYKKHKIILPLHMYSPFGGLNKNKSIEDPTKPEFNRINKYIIHHNDKKISLTISQTRCLYYLFRGYTVKETARAVSVNSSKKLISPRTIEAYLNNIKYKFGLQKKIRNSIFPLRKRN